VKALVTGGAGFIGHHLTTSLVRAGHDVVVLDNFTTGTQERLAALTGSIEVVRGDVRDPAAVRSAVAGCEVVFHEAAVVSVVASFDDPATVDAVNVGGTIQVILAAAAAGVRRVVFASSCAVYGDPTVLPVNEEWPPHPLSPYAVAKLAGEGYLHVLGGHHGLETVALRYFNVFGPGQDPRGEYAAVVPRFVTAAIAGERPTVFGDGRQTRDFVYVDNVVAANLSAAEAPGAGGLSVNVGTGLGVSLLDLLSAIERAAGHGVDAQFEPPRGGEVRDSRADISLAGERLGYRVGVGFDEGIERTLAWYRQRAAAAAP
jgi:UDP-glucose 4-epimerase